MPYHRLTRSPRRSMRSESPRRWRPRPCVHTSRRPSLRGWPPTRKSPPTPPGASTQPRTGCLHRSTRRRSTASAMPLPSSQARRRLSPAHGSSPIARRRPRPRSPRGCQRPSGWRASRIAALGMSRPSPIVCSAEHAAREEALGATGEELRRRHAEVVSALQGDQGDTPPRGRRGTAGADRGRRAGTGR